MILLIDNYDSFVHNLARYLRRLGATTQVVRNDHVDIALIREWQPQAIVISPGPCTPTQAGCSLEVVRELGGEIPILGVCLGHQAIGEALGGKIVLANQPMHGRASQIEHDQSGLFTGLPSPLTVGRYHSLVIDPQTVPSELKVTATTSDGTIMAVAHRQWPLLGVQFHPESILTEGGYLVLANFLRAAGIEPTAVPDVLDEHPPVEPEYVLPSRPVTF
ncbi:aminodeoxychorismate/anthranilate synthase component II [Anatilimnocola sp. NA78]|uniref:anthranilate synthase component II n=1 Tax=Anatilimnocola sp. NA78 TaxID=3415683 RepID=UPI003CE4E8BF